MYIVYVLIQKGPIDFTKQLVPTRMHRCSSIEEAFEKKRQEEESFYERAGHRNTSSFDGTMWRSSVISYDLNEELYIEIQEQ